mgnify:CR=1 FL=1
MRIFLDSSAFAKRFVEEAGSPEVDALCQSADELCLNVLSAPEVISALNRRKREGRLGRQEYVKIKERLLLEVREATIINLTPEVVSLSMKVLETAHVRTMDALHIASASLCHAELFVSGDHRQVAAARSMGLHIRQV